MFQTNVLGKNKAHFTLNDFFPENLADYEIMRKNVVQPDRPQMASTRDLYAG